MKRLKYFLLLFVCCFCVNVFADDIESSMPFMGYNFVANGYNRIFNCSSTACNTSVGLTRANNIYNGKTYNSYSSNGLIQSRMALNLEFSNNLLKDHEYTVNLLYDTLNMSNSTHPSFTIYSYGLGYNSTGGNSCTATSLQSVNYKSGSGYIVSCTFTPNTTNNYFSVYMTTSQAVGSGVQFFYFGASVLDGGKDISVSIVGAQDRTTNAVNGATAAISETNDTLKDDSIDNPSSSFDDMADLLPDNGVITDLIGLPITLLTKINTSVSGSCSSFSLGTLFDTEIVLPCIDISDYIGSSLWNVIDVLFSGFFVIVISKKMIAVFNNFSSMKEGDVLND